MGEQPRTVRHAPASVAGWCVQAALPLAIPVNPTKLERQSHRVTAVMVRPRIAAANVNLNKTEGYIAPPVLFFYLYLL